MNTSLSRLDEREFVHCVDASDRVIWTNRAWCDFAEENQVSRLSDAVRGASLWDFIRGRETRYLFQLMMEKVRREKGPLTVPFRCDAPDRRRFMEMTLRSGPDASVVFSSRLVKQEFRESVALLAGDAARSEELLHCCGWCKKFQLPSGQWEEAERAIVELGLFEAVAVPRISHGVCPVCSLQFRGLIF